MEAGLTTGIADGLACGDPEASPRRRLFTSDFKSTTAFARTASATTTMRRIAVSKRRTSLVVASKRSMVINQESVTRTCPSSTASPAWTEILATVPSVEA